MKRPNARQGLAAGASVATVALTAAAFWLSYEHLHDIAEANGLDGMRAWFWPATVDLFIIAGELLILRASLRHLVDWWAIALAASGSVGSIVLNVAGVGTDAERLEYVVAAVPPVAALLAFGALMRQVHEALAEHVEVDQAVPVPATLDRVPEMHPALEAAAPAVPDAPEDELTEDARAKYSDLIGRGGLPTYRELRDQFGIGSERAKRIREELQRGTA